MRVAIVGGGEIGFALAQALSVQDHEVSVVDQAPDVADRFESLDVEFILGNGTSLDVLTRAHVAGSDVFVACTGLDEVNIVSCAVAREVGTRETICFVSREDFLDLPQDARGLRAFGIDRVVWPEAQLAEDIERIVRAPGALDAESFAGGATRLLAVLEEGAGRVLELDVPDGYRPRALRELAAPLNSIIGAVVRGSEAFVPRGNSRIEPGDRIIVFTTHAAADRVRDYFTSVAS